MYSPAVRAGACFGECGVTASFLLIGRKPEGQTAPRGTGDCTDLPSLNLSLFSIFLAGRAPRFQHAMRFVRPRGSFKHWFDVTASGKLLEEHLLGASYSNAGWQSQNIEYRTC
ncbi:hypothetical protein AAFF_G00275600 [Aldrovandia affinis]|uniref:Uncharacterized protein n=1 Tax=Aldrovandia affinis TaxID=143900 RepID=A0AAD7RAV1_9TELE|nr:hypothetical protein AAFF_G00275600 [Aldrovandia affinis]